MLRSSASLGSGGSSASGSATSATVGPDAGGQRGQGLEVEVVQAGRVLRQHLADVGFGPVVEDLAQGEGRVRVGRLVVGIVAAPHHVVQADDLAHRLDIALGREAEPEPHVLLDVLGGRLRQDVLGLEPQLADRPLRPDGGEVAVELLEHAGQPAPTLLGEHELEAGEPLERARQQQEEQGPATEEGHLGDHHQRRGGYALIGGRAHAAVAVDRHLEVLAHRPQPVVVGMVVLVDPVDVGRQGRQQDAAAQPVVLDPVDVLDGVVEVVHEDLADAGPPLGVAPAEVDEPPVVGTDAGEPVLVLVGLGRPGEQHEAREERGHGVGEQDLAGHAVGVLLGVAHLVVPVAQPPLVAEVAEGVLVLPAPGVEVLEVALLEVLAVHGVAATGVGVGGDDGVPGVLAVRGARAHVLLLRTRLRFH